MGSGVRGEYRLVICRTLGRTQQRYIRSLRVIGPISQLIISTAYKDGKKIADCL